MLARAQLVADAVLAAVAPPGPHAGSGLDLPPPPGGWVLLRSAKSFYTVAAAAAAAAAADAAAVVVVVVFLLFSQRRWCVFDTCRLFSCTLRFVLKHVGWLCCRWCFAQDALPSSRHVEGVTCPRQRAARESMGLRRGDT